MNTNLRVGISCLAILFAAGGFSACTTQAASPTGGAGSTGSGGNGTTGTGGTPGGSGGAGGAYPTSDGVACLPVTMALITNFTYMPGDAATPDTTQVHFGDDTTTFSGSEYVYPAAGSASPLTSNVTGNNWHMTGPIGDYSGFGLSFDNCSHVDASAYKGISFTISGSVAMGNMITMDVGTLNDVIASSWQVAHGDTPDNIRNHPALQGRNTIPFPDNSRPR